MTDPGSVSRKALAWTKRTSAYRLLAYGLAAAAVASGVATVATMTGPAAQRYEVQTVLNLLYVDGILLLLLGFVVGRRVVQVWFEKRRGAAGASLHTRLAMLFSLVAVTPAILVAVFSALYLNFGIQVWFSDRVTTATTRSLDVADAYFSEHLKNIETDALAMANDLNLNAPILMRNKSAFEQLLSSHAALRSLSKAVVVDSSGDLIARARYNLDEDAASIPRRALATAARGEIVILNSENDERIGAFIRLNRFVDAYLLVEKLVDPRIVDQIDLMRSAVSDYQAMEKERTGIQLSFVLIFVVVALLLLLSAAWIGLTVAQQMANPISDLISAAGDVSAGNLAVRVETTDDSDEISSLSRAFNEMTGQLASQQEGLIEANQQLDERRKFTETVLAGVSAGVIALDATGNVHLQNRSASDLLAKGTDDLAGKPLRDIVPEMADLLDAVMRQPERMQQAEIDLPYADQPRTLHVRITAERLAGDVIGYVVTFDDVTELLSAQRKAAWADVARRIAHEIKNPLTPIQLSAERLRRKYVEEIKTDPDVFASCTETIIRQVTDIGRMVDEFSAFARMPQPSLKSENLSEICRQAVFLEQNRHPDIEFEIELPREDISLNCDALQISRALTNLLKNSAESIIENFDGKASSPAKGEVRLTASRDSGKEGSRVAVVIEDNGVGLPANMRERLTEPYVTTRTKGTGLGLAIVSKIMEDHRGELKLANRNDGGARISLVFHSIEPVDGADDALDGRPTDPLKTEIDLAVRGA